MTSRQLYTEDVDWPMMGRQFNDEDISVYFSLKKKTINKQRQRERDLLAVCISPLTEPRIWVFVVVVVVVVCLFVCFLLDCCCFCFFAPTAKQRAKWHSKDLILSDMVREYHQKRTGKTTL